MADINEVLEGLIDHLENATRLGESGIEIETKKWMETTKTGKSLTELGKATKGVTKGFKDSTKAMSSSSGDFNALSGAVNGVIGAMTGLLGKIPVVGGMIEGLGEAAQELATFTIQQTQAGFDAFQQLSTAGQIGADGMSGLAKAIDDAGMPLQTYAKLLTKNSEDLAYMSGSARAGGQIFQGVLKSMKEGEDDRLRNLGYTLEEISDTVIKFQKRERMIGYMRQMDAEQLREATVKYGSELDMIAKLTGKQRSQIEQERDRMMADDQFRAMLNELPNLTQEAKTKMMDSINSLEPGMRAGVKQIMASGTFVGEDAKKLAIQGMGADILQMRERFRSGEMSFREFNNAIIRSAKKHEKTFNRVTEITGQSVAVSQAEISNMARKHEISEEEAKIALENIKAQREGKDVATANATATMRTTQEVTARMNAMFLATGAGTEAMKAFAETINMATDLIAKAAGVKTSTQRKADAEFAKAGKEGAEKYGVDLGKGERGNIVARQSDELQRAIAILKERTANAVDDEDQEYVKAAQRQVDKLSIDVEDIVDDMFANESMASRHNIENDLGIADGMVLPSQAKKIREIIKAARAANDIEKRTEHGKTSMYVDPTVKAAIARAVQAEVTAGPKEVARPNAGRADLEKAFKAKKAQMMQADAAARADGIVMPGERAEVDQFKRELNGIRIAIEKLTTKQVEGNDIAKGIKTNTG